MSSDLSEYKSFALSKGLIFHYPIYLDIVSGGNWDYTLINPDGKNVLGILPYCYQRSSHGLKIKNYALLKYSGPWIDADLRETCRPSTIDKYVESMIDRLPVFGSFNQNFHPTFNESILFRYRGFNQGVRYTYILNTIRDHAELSAGFNQNIRRNLKKGKDQFSIEALADSCDFFDLVKKTANRRQVDMFVDLEMLDELVNICISENLGMVWVAKNKDDKPVATIFVVWDNFYMHYLVGGFDDSIPSDGAVAMLFVEAFKLASNKGIAFDFHGSMDRQIGNFFRSFGAELTPYFTLTKYNSKLLYVLDKLRM